MEKQTLTVTALNNRIKNLFELDPLLADVCVRGELSNYKIYPSGHHYFTLKDRESSLRCVMFRGSASKLRFRPENGMGVTVSGSVRVYTRDGAYQLYCTSLTPEGTGDLQVAFEQLKAKLSAEGLFDSAHKKPLPRYPGRIAVITSSAGAAVHDMIRVLGKRWPLCQVVLLPVRVQGAEAPAEIVGAIKYANRWKVGDLIITGRGGGSIEDLWAFNDERVARAIYDSELPVISAVGHEPDVTIADYVADLRAATPSNAAELAVPDAAELFPALLTTQKRLERAMEKMLARYGDRLRDLAGRRVMTSPETYVDQKRMELDYASQKLASAAHRSFAEKRGQYVSLAAKLDALSPLKVLSRGYSVAMLPGGEVIKSTEQVTAGDRLSLRLSDGSISCRVMEDDDNGKQHEL